MSLSLFARIPSRRPSPAKARHFALAVEDLEGRLVMSHAAIAAPVHAAAHVAATPKIHAAVPITVTGVNLTSVTQAANGVLTAVGTLTGTLLGHAITTPVTATVTPAATPKTCPVLNLHLGPIQLNLLGLNVNTSQICLNITASQGNGKLLGNLLCGGLTNVLNTATTATKAAPTGTTPDLGGALSGLNSTLNNATLLNGLSADLGRATAGLATPPVTNTATTSILHLAVGPVNLNLLGLNVHLDNCNNGPVTVNLTATQGPGNLLGNLLTGVANLLNAPGNRTGQVAGAVNNLLGAATRAPLA